MEKLTINEIKTFIFKTLNKKIYDEYTNATKVNNEHKYFIGNGMHIVILININTNNVSKIKLYYKGESLVSIQPYKKLLKSLCKTVKQIKNYDAKLSNN